VPFGYLIAVAVAAAAVLPALAPARRPRRLARLCWQLSMLVCESPFYALYWALAATLLALLQGDLNTPVGWVGFALACVTFAGVPVLVRRSLRARPLVEAELGVALPPLPWTRILVAPLPLARRGVERIANVPYADAGRFNLLDVYRPRSGAHGPGLLQLHGGGFRTGRKSIESRPLLLGLAGRGWLCLSANYRLRPATFPEMLSDVKRAIAWVRVHAVEYGLDPRHVFVAGSSAGAHLAATAALTANDPRFQPGFEDADTSVAAAICLYGYYGPAGGPASSPVDYVRADAPPFLIAHGDQDTLVPVDGARRFADRLRAESASPVAYVELPGAQHTFDLVHSIRFETLVDAIETFASDSTRGAPESPTWPPQ
jgi:acetyl esterase/lipase